MSIPPHQLADLAEAPTEENSTKARLLSDLIHGAPWAASLLVHVVIWLIFALVTMVIIRNQPETIFVPEAVLSETPGGLMRLSEKDIQYQTRQVQATAQRHHQRDTTAELSGDFQTDERIELIGIGSGGGGALAPMGFQAAAATPRSSFFGAGGNAYHIIYVVDRSGSMVTTFHDVRREMLVSISRLRPPQDFHVILFAAGEPIENPPKRLVPANQTQKEQVAEFLDAAKPEGSTDPVPALKRAFEILRLAGGKPGKLIYLLTDAKFQDNQAVLRAIRLENSDRAVAINTYLYSDRLPESEAVLQDIARENNGRFKYVSLDR